MSNQLSNHYSVLNCDENASKEELRKQYKKLVIKTHPDKNGSIDGNQGFHRIDRAIKVLDNDFTRRQYDSQLIDKRNEDIIINEELFLTDFTLNSETEIYCRDCRCGGGYCVDKNRLPVCETQTDVIIGCNCCSLSVKLKF